MQKLQSRRYMIHFRASFLNTLRGNLVCFPLKIFYRTVQKYESKQRWTKQRPRGCQSDPPGPEQEVTQVGWSSAPRSCSQAAGCDTPDQRPRPSHPDWSLERGLWVGTSLCHSALTLYSYSLPSSWKNTKRYSINITGKYHHTMQLNSKSITFEGQFKTSRFVNIKKTPTIHPHV